MLHTFKDNIYQRYTLHVKLNDFIILNRPLAQEALSRVKYDVQNIYLWMHYKNECIFIFVLISKYVSIFGTFCQFPIHIYIGPSFFLLGKKILYLYI